MAKITLDTITSGFQSTSQVNNNNSDIVTEFNNKVLYRDNPGGEPNQMENDLDMNSNDILNTESIGCQSLTIAGVNITSEDASVSTLPDQAGQGGKYLATNGSAASWNPLEYQSLHTGAVLTSIDGKLSEQISPLEFGGVGDGVTDDSVALIAAITAANGGVLDLSGLTYRIETSALVNCPLGITIQNGKVLCDFAVQQESGIRITGSGPMRLFNFEIDGQNTVAKLFRFRSDGTTTTVVLDGYVGNNALQTALPTGLASAFQCDVETDPDDLFQSIQISNSRFTNVDSVGGSLVGRGVALDSCNQTLVTNCHFEEIGPFQDGDGIFVTDATSFGELRFNISNCTFKNCHKRSIKSQVGKTRVSNILCQRTIPFTAADGQSEVSLQDGGIVDGVTCYYSDGAAPTSIISCDLRTDGRPFQVKNITISAEEPDNVINAIVFIGQEEDIFCLDTVIENVQYNCYSRYFAHLFGNAFSSLPGSSSAYVFDNMIFRNITGRGFDPAKTIDGVSGQIMSGFINMTRSASGYVQARYSAFNVQIGTDDAYPAAYLNTLQGTLTFLEADLTDHFKFSGNDNLSYDGTGDGTFNVSPSVEYVPNIKAANVEESILSENVSVKEDATYSQTYSLGQEGGCKVMVMYGSRDSVGAKLHTEGFLVNGGGVTDYFETVSGDKTDTATGTIAITPNGANEEFTVSKTAGSLSASGRISIIIQHPANVVRV